MSDNELLFAISNLMDIKLEPVYERLDRIDTRLDKVEFTLENDVLPHLANIEATINKDIKPRLANIEAAIDKDIKPRVTNIEITIENDVVPRIGNIESCYISTYQRYQSGVMQFDELQEDISIIKRVVADHSAKIQKFA